MDYKKCLGNSNTNLILTFGNSKLQIKNRFITHFNIIRVRQKYIKEILTRNLK